jgi:hypothetical protein
MKVKKKSIPGTVQPKLKINHQSPKLKMKSKKLTTNEELKNSKNIYTKRSDCRYNNDGYCCLTAHIKNSKERIKNTKSR